MCKPILVRPLFLLGCLHGEPPKEDVFPTKDDSTKSAENNTEKLGK